MIGKDSSTFIVSIWSDITPPPPSLAFSHHITADLFDITSRHAFVDTS